MKSISVPLVALSLLSTVFCQGWIQLNQSGSVPSIRSEYSYAIEPQSNDFLLFGGSGESNYNDFYRFSFTSYNWSLISAVSGSVPGVRFGQTSAIEPVSGDFLVFGGQVNGDDDNDFWRFSFISYTWTLITNTGDVPGPVVYQSSAIEPISGDFLVFGGSTECGSSNDFYRYSFVYGNWSIINSDNPSFVPSARYASSSGIEPVSGDFFVFGGSSSGSYVNELWRFSFDTNLWSQVSYNSSIVPPGRALCASGINNLDGNLLIFGGYNSTYYNDFWSFSFNTSTWTQIDEGSGAIPSARKTSGAINPQTDSFLIFGGINSENTPAFFNDAWLYSFDTPAVSSYTTPVETTTVTSSTPAITQSPTSTVEATTQILVSTSVITSASTVFSRTIQTSTVETSSLQVSSTMTVPQTIASWTGSNSTIASTNSATIYNISIATTSVSITPSMTAQVQSTATAEAAAGHIVTDKGLGFFIASFIYAILA